MDQRPNAQLNFVRHVVNRDIVTFNDSRIDNKTRYQINIGIDTPRCSISIVPYLVYVQENNITKTPSEQQLQRKYNCTVLFFHFFCPQH